MAKEEKKQDKDPEKEEREPKGKGGGAEAGAPPPEKKKFRLPINLTLLLFVVNSIAIMAALGMLVYTKLIFKRPAITETSERQRLTEKKTSAEAMKATKSGMVIFKPMAVPIESNVPPADASQTEGKLHYASIGFALEIRDVAKLDKVEAIRPIFLDKIIHIMGTKKFSDLNTVQGRYLLRMDFQDIANGLVNEPLITNVFFTEFIVQ